MYKFHMKKINLLLCFILIIETIVIKFLQYKVLPAKYFYDSEKILAIMNGSTLTDKGYSFTANFFNTINIFNFHSIQQWSILISAIFLIVFLVIFAKKKLNMVNFIYIIASFALMNIYVFNLTKDIIQLIFFLMVYLICSNKKVTDKNKILFSSIVFIIESLFFRTYYLIIGALVIGFYCIYTYFLNSKKKTKKKTSFIIFTAFSLFMFMIYILQKISSENYMILINARNSSNLYRDTTDAVTMIIDFLPNTNFFSFILNYIINAFRILFPIELFTKGIKYLPFVVFQFFVSIVLLKNAIRIRKEKMVYLFVCMAFVMVSIIYEPDFGSVVRHESVLMLFILKLIDKERIVINSEKESISNNTNI